MKIGLIGCGGIAAHMHVPAVLAYGGVEFHWIMDADRATADSLAVEFGIGPVVDTIPPATDGHDSVIITTPPHVRPRLTEMAVQAGYHVLAEKPLGNTVAECQAQIDAARTAGKLLAVSHQYRFWPSRQAVKIWIDEERLGPVTSVSMSQGKPYSWVSKTGYTMLRDQVPGGVLINAGIHPLDTMLWWLGDPNEIQYTDDSLGGLESNFEMKLRFPGDVVGSLVQSRTSNLRDEIRVVCRDGEILLSTYSRRELIILRDGQKAMEIVGSTDDASLPAREQLKSFHQAVVNRAEPVVNGKEAMRCIAAIQQCYQMKREREIPTAAPIPGTLS